MKTRILLIDDERDVLDVLDKILAAEGYETETATNGEDGIDLFARKTFDIVITDLRMPGIDGIEVIKKIKQIDADVEIIVLTGFASIENAVETLKDDRAFDFLTKPLVNIENFVN